MLVWQMFSAMFLITTQKCRTRIRMVYTCLLYTSYSYAPILREVAGDFGIELDVIEETPMNGLIDFHSLNIEEP